MGPSINDVRTLGGGDFLSTYSIISWTESMHWRLFRCSQQIVVRQPKNNQNLKISTKIGKNIYLLIGKIGTLQNILNPPRGYLKFFKIILIFLNKKLKWFNQYALIGFSRTFCARIYLCSWFFVIFCTWFNSLVHYLPFYFSYVLLFPYQKELHL